MTETVCRVRGAWRGQKESALRREWQRLSMLDGVWGGAREAQEPTIGRHFGICGVKKVNLAWQAIVARFSGA